MQPPNPEKILQTGLAFWPSKTLLSAIEMGVFTELARGPEAYEPLRAVSVCIPRSARDFLDALVALGFLTRERRSLRQHAGDRPLPRPEEAVVHRRHSRDGATTGCTGSGATSPRRCGPVSRRTNQGRRSGSLRGALRRSRHGSSGFLAAMTGLSRGANMAIARKFPWKNYKTFVDVGTAQGDLAAQIALANPHLAGQRVRPPRSGADLRGVRRRRSASPIACRSCRATSSRRTLPKADVVLMGHILHDWDLPTKKMLIRKAFDALPPAARSSSTRRSSTTIVRRTPLGC